MVIDLIAMKENAAIMARHGALPTRDLLEAHDQLLRSRATLDEIQANTAHMAASSLAQRQAD